MLQVHSWSFLNFLSWSSRSWGLRWGFSSFSRGWSESFLDFLVFGKHHIQLLLVSVFAILQLTVPVLKRANLGLQNFLHLFGFILDLQELIVQIFVFALEKLAVVFVHLVHLLLDFRHFKHLTVELFLQLSKLLLKCLYHLSIFCCSRCRCRHRCRRGWRGLGGVGLALWWGLGARSLLAWGSGGAGKLGIRGDWRLFLLFGSHLYSC